MTSLVRTNAYFEKSWATVCANTLITAGHRQGQGAVIGWRINGNIGMVKFIEVWNHVNTWEKLEGRRNAREEYCKSGEMHD